MTTERPRAHDTGQTAEPLAFKLTAELGQLPPQRKGQYLTMTICGTTDDPAENGHWSSPERVQWRIDKAVAAERELCAVALQMLGMDEASAVIRARCTPQRA